jgi:hypothetical protein
LKFDCNGDPLEELERGGVCTSGPNTGICDGGLCNCGPGGKYDEDANVCFCTQTNVETCAESDQCCEVLEVCFVNPEFQTEFTCIDCVSTAKR